MKNRAMRLTVKLAGATLMLFGTTGFNKAQAHCQVPCGIYDQPLRIKAVKEDILTIKMAVAKIRALAGKKDPQSKNQLVRWVMVKEQHAERIMRTMADYFMAQKIKPAPKTNKSAFKKYVDLLTGHHEVMVAAMKCKQTSDLKAVDRLGQALRSISKFWTHDKH